MPFLTTAGVLAVGLGAGLSGQATPCGRNAMFAVVGRAGSPTPERVKQLALYGLGLTMGAVLMGSVLVGMNVGLRTLIPAARLPIAGLGVLIGLAYIILPLAGVSLRVPTSQWVVPRSWGHQGSALFALKFGVVLGMGFLTIVPFAGYYLLVIVLLLVPPELPLWGMLTFAGARWLTAAVSTTSAIIAEQAGYNVTHVGLSRGLGPIDQFLPVLRTVSLVAGLALAGLSVL